MAITAPLLTRTWHSRENTHQIRVSVSCWPTRFVLEPYLNRLVPRVLGEHSRYRRRNVVLKTSCAAGSDFECCGRTESR